MDSEVWKPIPGYEGTHEASSHGRIRSVDRTIDTVQRGKVVRVSYKSKIYKTDQSISRSGYRQYPIFRDDTQFVHRLVALAFLGLPSDGDRVVVNHKDGDRLNNHYTNLEWVSHAENNRHARMFLKKGGKLKPFQIEQMFIMNMAGVSPPKIAKAFDVFPKAVLNVLSGETWRSDEHPEVARIREMYKPILFVGKRPSDEELRAAVEEAKRYHISRTVISGYRQMEQEVLG
jgi:hypothetical protein